MANEFRSKFAYLSYDEMLHRIYTEELNAYDFVFGKDRHEFFIVSPEGKPISVKSRISVFNSIEEAEEKLNEESSTYKGQLVAILDNGNYRGYIVNKVDGVYKVFSLYENPNQLDYNALGNVPIINLVGTLDNTVIVGRLDTGTYCIKGQYKIADNGGTTYLSASGDLIIVDGDVNPIKVKRITVDTITDYEVENGNIVTTNAYATQQYLEEKGYGSAEYIDQKITAFEESVKDDIEVYLEGLIEQVFATKVDEIIEERFEVKISELIIEATEQEIRDVLN